MALFHSARLNQLYADEPRSSGLSKEDEQSLLDSVLSGGGSLLGTIGSILDAPGGFVRTTLAGENPFPGIFDPSQRVSGRKLLEGAGILSANEEGLDIGDVLGFGTEVATDPLSFIGGGTTKAGALAEKLGVLPKRSISSLVDGSLELGKRTARRAPLESVLAGADDATKALAETLATKGGDTLESLMKQPMQQSIGVGVPGFGNQLTFDLPGAAGRAKAFDKIGHYIGTSAPGAALSRMFDRAAGNAVLPTTQEASKRFFEERGKAIPELGVELDKAFFNLDQAGFGELDAARNLMEQVDPANMLGGKLSVEDAVLKNLPKIEGEAVEQTQARAAMALESVNSIKSLADKIRQQGIDMGVVNPNQRLESNLIEYIHRSGTQPGKNKTGFGYSRDKQLAHIPTTLINDVVKDPELRDLAQKIDIDPLSPESLMKPTDQRILHELENMGATDLEDLTSWQAEGMRNGDPQLEAWNKVADEKEAMRQAAGGPYPFAGDGLERPVMSRTVAPPKIDIDKAAHREAVDYAAKKYLGVTDETFAKEGALRETARSLSAVKDELADLHKRVATGEQFQTAADKLNMAELLLGDAKQSAEQFRARKADLDSREIFSREVDESFDIEKLTPDELSGLRSAQDRAAQGTPAVRKRMERLLATANELKAQAAKLSESTDQMIREAEFSAARTGRDVGKRAIEDHLDKIDKLVQRGKGMEDEAAAAKSLIDDADAATGELAAMEADYRAHGGYFTKTTPYLKDQEIRDLAALRMGADKVPYWQRKVKALQEEVAAGGRELNHAEQIDLLNGQIGAAEAAQVELEALSAQRKMAAALVKRAKETPQEAFDRGAGMFDNHALVDTEGKLIHDLEKQLHISHHAKQGVAQARLVPIGEPLPGDTLPLVKFLHSIGVGKDATSLNNALRKFIPEMQKSGQLTAEQIDNIVGPHAVATSAMKSDPAAATALRVEAIQQASQRVDAELGKRVALVNSDVTAGKLTPQAAQQQIAEMERLAQARKVDIAIKTKDPATSTIGKLRVEREGIANTMKERMQESVAQGLIEPEEQTTILNSIDNWLKTGKGLDEAEELWSKVKSENPIPDDGLVMLNRIVVPVNVAEDIKRALAPFSSGKDGQNFFLKQFDKWTGILKSHLTQPWLSYLVRNNVGAAWQHYASGSGDPRHGLLGLFQPVLDAKNILTGKNLDDLHTLPIFAGRNLTPKQAQQEVMAAANRFVNIHGAGKLTGEVAEPTFIEGVKHAAEDWGQGLDAIGGQIPGVNPMNPAASVTDAFKSLGTKAGWNPLNVETFAPIVAGAKANNFAENLWRMSSFIGQLRQGKTFDVAAAISKAAHVDYSMLSKFERETMRRLIPFYSFTRGMVPWVVKDLWKNPGGRTAQAIRAENNLGKDAGGFLPPQLANTLAIPLGKEADGTQRFLSQFDLPFETLNKVIVPGRNVTDTLEKTARNLISQSNPLGPKLLAETAFGKSSFQGRNLADLDSTSGRLAAELTGNEESLWGPNFGDSLLNASPLSRYLSTTRQLLDDRPGKTGLDKLLNIGTGARMTLVDMDKARNIAAGSAIKDALKDMGARGFEMIRFSKAELDSLSPEDRKEAIKLQALMDAMKRDAKAKK